MTQDNGADKGADKQLDKQQEQDLNGGKPETNVELENLKKDLAGKDSKISELIKTFTFELIDTFCGQKIFKNSDERWKRLSSDDKRWGSD